MTPSGLYKITLISALALAVSGVFACITYPLAGKDPLQYDRLGYNLAMGRGFSLSENAPFKPTMFREPLYPLFLAGIYTVAGHHIRVAIIAQMILHMATALLTFFIARQIFSEKAAFVSAVLVAVFPTLTNASSYIMSETFFSFLLCLGIAVCVVAMQKKNFLLFAAAGAVLGAVSLTKTIALFLPFALAAAVLSVSMIKKDGVKRACICSLCLIAAFCVAVLPWAARNAKLFHTFSLVSIRGGEVLWSRAEKIDDTPREVAATVCCSFSEYAAKKLFPDLIAESNRYLYKDLGKAIELESRYAREGMSEAEIDGILRNEALDKISRHPFKYASYTFIEMIKMTAFTYLPLLNEPGSIRRFADIGNGDALLSTARGVMRAVAYPLLALFLIGMARSLSDWDRWLPLFMVIAYFNVLYSLVDAIGRYGVPLIPFYCMFAAAALYKRRVDTV